MLLYKQLDGVVAELGHQFLCDKACDTCRQDVMLTLDKCNVGGPGPSPLLVVARGPTDHVLLPIAPVASHRLTTHVSGQPSSGGQREEDQDHVHLGEEDVGALAGGGGREKVLAVARRAL